jgi:hypothetical protein
VGARGSKAVRLLAVVLASLLWLYACTQPPNMPSIDDDENDIYRCYLNKDGTLLICPEKVKPTKVAGG